MSRITILAALVAVVGLLVAPPMRTEAEDAGKPAMTIKSVMTKLHKGKEAPVHKVEDGSADEATLKEFLASYEFMAAQKAPQGDEELWKKKTAALVEATKAVIAKAANAGEAFKTAADCKGCHSVFKPKAAAK